MAAALAPSGLGTFVTFPKKRIELALYQLASSWPVHPGSSNVAQGSRCEALDKGGRSPVSPWGQSAKGLKTRRPKRSDKFMITRRKKRK